MEALTTQGQQGITWLELLIAYEAKHGIVSNKRHLVAQNAQRTSEALAGQGATKTAGAGLPWPATLHGALA